MNYYSLVWMEPKFQVYWYISFKTLFKNSSVITAYTLNFLCAILLSAEVQNQEAQNGNKVERKLSF